MPSLVRAFGCLVTTGYGLTETAGAIAAGLWRNGKSGSLSVGRPLDDVEYAIDRGELVVRTSRLAQGLLDSRGAVVPIADDDGWFRTGDAASLGADGALTIEGRIGDFARRGSNELPFAIIENSLLDAIEELRAVFLFAIPHRDSVQLRAKVELHNVNRLREVSQVIRAHCIQEFGPEAVPHRIVAEQIDRARDGEVRRLELHG